MFLAFIKSTQSRLKKNGFNTNFTTETLADKCHKFLVLMIHNVFNA